MAYGAASGDRPTCVRRSTTESKPFNRYIVRLRSDSLVTMTILCEPDAQLAGALASCIGGDVRIVPWLPDAATALAASPRERVLIVGPGSPLEPALTFVAALRGIRDDLVVLLLHDRPAAVLDRAVAAGASDVLAADDGEGLRAACRRANDARRLGQVITVFAARDGSGKTTFASNLAAVLHGGGTRRVCLVDLDLEFGDLAGVLGVTPRRALVDESAAGAMRLTTTLAPGLDAVLAPSVAGQAARLPLPLVENLLDTLPGAYDHVVVDTPARFTPHVLAALDRSSHRVVLTTPESPALKSLRELLDTLDLLSYEHAARSIVVNRMGGRGTLSPAAIGRAVRGQISAWLPSSDDVPASINAGVPLVVSQPDHPVSRAIRQFALGRLLGVQPSCIPEDGAA